LNPPGLAQPSTGSVAAAFMGGQLSVGGDLEIKSGDALVTATGPAGLISGVFPLSDELDGVFQLPNLDIDEELAALGARAPIVIGGTYQLHPSFSTRAVLTGWLVAGSLVVSSGSITGLPDGDLTAGLAAFNLAGSELTASSVSVVSGHGHNGFVSLILGGATLAGTHKRRTTHTRHTRHTRHTHTHTTHTQHH
jgi:hypothetical protein